jgi:DNA invertase Pin-like site-specific DNA recombinase
MGRLDDYTLKGELLYRIIIHRLHGATMDVLAYLRVSTDEQGRSGLGLDAQRSTIEQEGDRRDWLVVEWIEDNASGKSLHRPGIQRALERLEDSGPRVLVAAKLDRLSRSAIDFLGLVKRAEDRGWSLIVLDPNVDMTNPYGRFTAGILAQVAELEREMIGQRTRDALAAARRRGVRLGRPVTTPDETRELIVRKRKAGSTLQEIADHLNNQATPTAQGGARWWPSTIRAVLRSLEIDQGAG